MNNERSLAKEITEGFEALKSMRNNESVAWITKKGTREMTLVKWTGTILCLIGIFLTSINVYPSNIWFGVVGSGIWAFAGIYQRDIPLFLVEAVAVAFYAYGVITYYF